MLQKKEEKKKEEKTGLPCLLVEVGVQVTQM